MQFRNLQTTAGGSSYIVSLPKDWVEHRKIKKGEPLAIRVGEGNSLVIFPASEAERPRETRRINWDGKSIRYLLRRIIGKYVNGVYRIEVHGDITWEDEKRLMEWINAFMLGATMVRDSEEVLSITVAIDETEVPPAKVLRRAHLITYWMYQQAISQILKGEFNLTADILGRDREVDKLHIVCLRGLNKSISDPDFRAKIEIKRQGIADYFRIIDYTELIADLCCELALFAEVLSEHKADKKSLHKFELHAAAVGELYNEAMVAFFKGDVDLSNKIIEKCVGLRQTSIRRASRSVVPEQKTKEAAGAMSDSFNALLAIIDNIKHISELNIDRCIR